MGDITYLLHAGDYHKRDITRHDFLGESRACGSANLELQCRELSDYNDIYFLCRQVSPAVGYRMESAGSCPFAISRILFS